MPEHQRRRGAYLTLRRVSRRYSAQEFDAVAETQVSLTPRHFSHSAGLAVFYDEKNFAYLRLYPSESLRSTALGIVLLRAGTKQELLAYRAAVDSDEVVLRPRA